MVFITQLIYILEGQEAVFNQFEALVIPRITKYNGQLLFRLRPGPDAYIESHVEKPYEIHLVAFETESDFINYMRDEERKAFLHLKEQSIKSALLIKGERLG
jgi:hypothetical protein